MSLFFSKPKTELIALFDVGSSSVGGALVLKDGKNIPTFIFSIREPIHLTENFVFDRFFNATLQSLEKVAKQINLSGLGAVTKIYCTFSSPWYASQTRNIQLEKNISFTFTSKIAEHLNKKEYLLFEEENIKKFENGLSDARIIESKNMSVALNGYRVQNPIGIKTKKVEMSLFVSMSNQHILTKIEESIGRHLHFKNIKFSSFIFSFFTTLRDLFNTYEDFLCIDIGGEITEIGLVKKDVLVESVSFPYGKNFILRNLSKKLGYDIDHTKSLFALYIEGHLERKMTEKIIKELHSITNEWLKQFGASLNLLSNHMLLPHTLFFSTDEDMIQYFTEVMQKEETHQYTKTISKFKIIPIDTKILHGNAHFSEAVSRDSALIMQSIYINRYNA
ncbi:MAG: hypothetical protein V4504_00125 [Patescibacteria group bacterium]